jgi:SanA protein
MHAMPPDERLSHRHWARRWAMLSTATGAGFLLARSVQREGAQRIVAPESARAEVALVLGSLVNRGITPILADRVSTAVELFHAKKVARLRLTGSTAVETGNEVAAMEELALAGGVPRSAIELDPRGRHTFESMVEAKAAGCSGIVVVTQRFHLPRALYLAQKVGLDAVGVAADRRVYEGIRDYQGRELFSSVLAYWLAR